jgi:hypothetical protein
MAYDLTQDFSGGFKPSYLIPLDYNTNIIPQDSIISIAVSSSMEPAVNGRRRRHTRP